MNDLLNKLKDLMVTNSDDLVGRKITGVERDWNDGLYLAFDDGRFAIIKAARGYEDSVELEFETSVNQWDDLDNLVDLGIVPEASRDAYVAYQQAESKKATEARERAEFEKLRRKFQPEAIPTPKTNQLGWPEE